MTVVPTGTDTLDGLNAKLEMLIATGAGGTVVVVGGGGGGWVVVGVDGDGDGFGAGAGVWIAAPEVAGPLEGVPAAGGVVDGAPDWFPAVLGAALLGAPLPLSVVEVTEPFPAGLVVVVPRPRECDWPECGVVLDRVPMLEGADELPQAAAVSVTSASPTSTRMARVVRGVCTLSASVSMLGAS